MSALTKLLSLSLLGSLVFLPYLASSGGWGLPTERNAQILAALHRDCPSNLRAPDGRCVRTHRSYLRGSTRTGSRSWGK